MRTYLVAAIAATISIPLVACSGKHIDARQLDLNNGLVYQHGLTTPFTGTVEWTDRIPNELVQFWSNVTSTNLTSSAASCETQFSTGIMEGLATCSAANGQKILEVTFKNETYEGDSKFYSPVTGKLNRELHWSAGKLDGTAEIYTDDGKQLLQKVSWKNGVQDGPAKVWAADGTLQSDTVWSNGKTISGTINDAKGSYEYKDGQLDGPAAWLSPVDRTVISKGTYSAGKREGQWIDQVNSFNSDVIGQFTSVLLKEMEEPFPITRTDRFVTTWSDDVLNGLVQVIGKDGSTILSGAFKNGKLDGPIKFVHEDSEVESSSFADGLLQGERKVYLSDNTHLMLDENWNAGVLDGQAREWDANGGLIVALQMNQGKPLSGTLTEKMNEYQAGPQVSAIGSLIDSGTLINQVMGTVASEFQRPIYALFGPLGRISLSFANGRLNGSVQIFDQGGAAVLDGAFKDGKLDGQVQYTDRTGVKSLRVFQDGQASSTSPLAAQNPASVTAR